MFLFDTGATFVVLDRSFEHLLGKPFTLKEAEAHLGVELYEKGIMTTDSKVPLVLYKPIPLKLGRFQIANRFPYMLADLQSLWPVSGVEFCGVLGSSFLHQFRWDIDFDKGEIKGYLGFSPYEEERESHTSISWSSSQIPQVMAHVGKKELLVDLDTGDTGSGRLQEEMISHLKHRGVIVKTDMTDIYTASGSSTAEEFRLPSLHFADKAYHGVLMNASQQNALGLRFLKRHNIVLDFPFKRLYLKKRLNRSDWDDIDKSGIRLVLKEKKIIVFSIRPLKGAHAESVRQGDEIISINGQKNLSLFQARRMFRGKEGTELTLGIKRRDKYHTINIKLGKDPLSVN